MSGLTHPPNAALAVSESRHSSVVKRALDVLGAVTLMVALAPLLFAAIALIRLDSPGPVLFRQRRTGWKGEEFQLLKLRTMYHGSENRRRVLAVRNESDGHLFKIRADPRITPVGHWLRRFSLDEAPQLLNVIVGHMSLVGPRPLPVEDSAFDEDARRRLLVRPGLTGLWQISGRSDLSWEDTVRLDLRYVDTRSLRLDLQILARTPAAVLRGNGAY
jgi:lipopolysaccharide/colanic/teichoic acid biosynthesis glycosyltransferase